MIDAPVIRSGDLMKTLILVALALALTGCGGMAEVMPVGKDTYSLGSTQVWGMKSWGTLRVEAEKRATAFCDSKRLHMVEVSMQTHGAMGWTPMDTSLTFRCVSDTDPAWTNPGAH